MAVSGTLAIFPWITLKDPFLVGGFRFIPVSTDNIELETGAEIAEPARLVLSRYVDLLGKPIPSCTLALRPRHDRPWDIPREMWSKLYRASECLALTSMAEQRFFEQFVPHINATLFRPILHGVSADHDRLALSVYRRGGGYRVSNLKIKNVTFQAPLETLGTTATPPSKRFAQALDRSRTSRSAAWSAISEALPFFLLGHAETIEVTEETNLLLSALAFERLLTNNNSRPRNSNQISEAFSDLWGDFVTATLKDTRRIKLDPHSQHSKEQVNWPVHRKWMKELYEARSEQAHGSKHPDRSKNWLPWQHVVISAFAFPLSIKLLLASDGKYNLSAREQGACQALDQLLVSKMDWSGESPPQWPKILSEFEGNKYLEEIISRSISETQ